MICDGKCGVRKLHRIIRVINSESMPVNFIYQSPILFSALAGLLAVGGFAPFNIFLLPIIALTILFVIWDAASVRGAMVSGFAFGCGLFGGGISWIYVALHQFGQMPLPLAALATALFVAFFALFYGALGYVQAKFLLPRWAKFSLLLPALWVATELLRGYLLTGFPWLAIGYTQIPNSPLRGFAPIFGVYGVSLAVAMSAGLLAFLLVSGRLHLKKIGGGLLLVWLLGAAFSAMQWTTPDGAPLRVSLLQGNIEQDEKFAESQLLNTFETYRRLLESSDAQLIVLPETALPVLRHDVPESYSERLQAHVKNNGGDVLVGAFEYDRTGIYNAAYSLGAAPSQHYRKAHLVPFGEFIPLRSVFGWLVNDLLQIPMSDLSSGGTQQAPLKIAGQRVAVNICYEDVFGEEIIRALPDASLLVNITNDAWYGDSLAAIQHNQIAQTRALETGRMMLRATNTGVTAIIGADGRVQAQLPQHQVGVLTGVAQGYAGSTPFVRWGNAAVALLVSLLLLFAWRLRSAK